MGLDVETPTPPDLTNRPLPSAIDPDSVVDTTGDLRREELEAMLRDGAWDDAFAAWAEDTEFNEAEFAAVRDAGLIEELDVFWHPETGRVEFELPAIPEGDAAPAEAVRSELSDLAEIVTDVLEADYVDWETTESDDQEA